jgi:MFS family permease
MNIHPHAGGFVITAGAILGICAGLLWTAQGSLMLAYPTESQKGKYISIFWSIFNLGGVVGASVSLGQNFHSTVRRLCLHSLQSSDAMPNQPVELWCVVISMCICLGADLIMSSQSWEWDLRAYSHGLVVHLFKSFHFMHRSAS